MIYYHRWFGSYARSFLSKAPRRYRQAMGLKLIHSEKVRGLAKRLSVEIGLGERERFLCELSGLFHDVGRLPQFRKYKTFLDSKSEDHALLSVKVLREHGVLGRLHSEEKEMVLDAIYVHNKFSIPRDFEGLRLTLAKIVRDADKIDIWRVFNEFYTRGKGSQEINLGFPPGDSISNDVIGDFEAGRIVNLGHVRNQLDFMVMRLSWLYDINFKESLEIIVQGNYIETILGRLPAGDKKQAITQGISRLLKERLNR